MKRKVALLIAVSGLLAIALVALPWSSGSIGKGDFVGYWSASRLLLEGRDPYNADALRTLQQQVYPERGYLVYTWNPPWLLALLLPLAALPFLAATRLWLLGNVVIMLLTSLGLWRLFAPDDRRGVWVAGLAGVLFPPSLAAIGAGQIVPWVLLASVVLFSWQWRKRLLHLAGGLLLIVLLKPQVTFLTVALSGWHSLRRRQCVFFGSSVAVGLGLLALVTLLYPAWLSSYGQNIGERGVTQWQTPTLGGLLLALWPVSWLRYVGLFAVVCAPLLDRQYAESTYAGGALNVTLALGVALAPFGWSFDQILLLPLILQVIAWNRQQARWWVTVGLGLLYVIPFVMRVVQVDEFLYSWVPWLALGLYWVASRQPRADHS